MQLSDMNTIVLSGTLQGPPQVHTLPGDNAPVCHMKLLSVRRFLNASCELEERPNLINLVLYKDKTQLAASLTTGDRIVVEGELTIRSTSRTTNSTTTEVTVQNLYQLSPQAGTIATNEVLNWG
jgi:single-stranded DNA-binding protein